jgi:hypothetical protein
LIHCHVDIDAATVRLFQNDVVTETDAVKDRFQLVEPIRSRARHPQEEVELCVGADTKARPGIGR